MGVSGYTIGTRTQVAGLGGVDGPAWESEIEGEMGL